MPMLQVNSLRFYIEEQGDGPPLLLILGMASTTRLWGLTAPALADRFRTVLFDPRGAGQSEATSGPYSARLLAEDALGILDRLGIPKAHVVGWSMGGMAAQELAIRHPDRVDRLALIATFARPRPPLVDWWMKFGHWARARDPEPLPFAFWQTPWFYTPAFFQDPDAVARLIEQAVEVGPPVGTEVYLAQAQACLGHDTLDRLPTIRSETLVLVGAEDILTPPYYSEEIAARIPRATLKVLPRGGHGMPVEFADDVNQALLEFLLR